ncbi:hypothetical protein RAJCM14343_3541 [Rhodococcus aetherivorans]|uniref:Uncharacterized protein n=1 Tax=Rhodococcus aetherivorans TaxID=191292 RepID=A0ABQ0YP87_9NOCA|nr:hypothetical protein RAJCM14343_3541 [Rhodococcus aetherivorans]CCW12592.1 hypothetical protein EBESD8_31420 [Rhodococcus aetherivorans]
MHRSAARRRLTVRTATRLRVCVTPLPQERQVHRTTLCTPRKLQSQITEG